METKKSIPTENVIPGCKFGRWTVLEDQTASPKGEKKWLCRCDCGTERYVLERSLKYGGSLSCGCLRKERANEAISPNLTGKQFGELTVIRKLKSADSSSARWLCKCSCGDTYIVYGTLLMTGKRTRCSSKKHQKNYAFIDITGQRFGRLVAEYPTDKRSSKGSVIWHCRCDCGEEVEVSYNILVYSHMRSCGCQKKEHEQNLKTFLTHVDGTSIDMLKSKKIPSNNTTGVKGVYFIKGKYEAKIVFQKKQYYLGKYDNLQDAATVRKEAEELLNTTVVNHYEKWEARAKEDPEWAEKNPIKIDVTKDGISGLSVVCMPNLDD